MDGVLIVDKPRGISSAKALYRVRKILGQRKSGHAGTLDPAADGVLILCLGKATKLVEAMMDLPKIYRATARLDVTSTSFDSDRPLVEVPIQAVPGETQIRAALARFEGEIEQVPPAVSALKIGGRPAYELERKGKPVVLAPRRVRIYWTHLHRLSWPEVDFEMACGRGTYVRAIVRDLGAILQTGGCLTSLSRLAVGPFRREDAITLERLESAAAPAEGVIPIGMAEDLLTKRVPPPRPL
jgi:tRNA pseudouridine55 synthase